MLYGTLLVCAACIGWAAWRYDLYDREPLGPILVAVGAGAAFMWIAGHVQGWLISRTVDVAHELAGNALWATFAGVTEEIAKLTAVGVVFVTCRRHFNDPMDGLVYGAFAGLGAAIEESVFHLGFRVQSGLLPAQEPVRLAGHLIMGGIGGFGVGMLALGRRTWWLWTIASLTGATVLHVLWDVVAFAAADRAAAGGTPLRKHIVAGMMLMLLGMVVFRRLVEVGSRLSRRKFVSGPLSESP